jgi:hypothetical protein
MISLSARPGHSRDSASVLPLARAIRLRAKRLATSVVMRLRLASDTPNLDGRRSRGESFLIRKRVQDTILKVRESLGSSEIAVQNQDLTSRAA